VVNERVSSPRSSDEPPFSFGVGGKKIGEGDSEGIVSEDCR